MNKHVSRSLVLVLLALFSAPVFAIEGKWFTDADRALESAGRSRQPVLAVAMDHG